jgi:DNA-binding SARP family transcriptional activator
VPQVCVDLLLFGEPRICLGTAPAKLSRGSLMLLAYLVLGPAEGRSRASMAAELFAECPESAARRRLSTCLWRLRNESRQLLGTEIVRREDDDWVALNDTVSLRVDAGEFGALVDRPLRRSAGELGDAGADTLARAVALYRGGLLESAYEDWVLAERGRLADACLRALDYLVQFHGTRHATGQVAAYAGRALAMEPLREDLHRHVMIAYAACGRPDLVERQFEDCRQGLLRELGADPMPETLALYSTLVTGRATAATPAAPGAVGGRPGPGAAAPGPGAIASLVAELQQVRGEMQRLSALVDRALDNVARLR